MKHKKSNKLKVLATTAILSTMFLGCHYHDPKDIRKESSRQREKITKLEETVSKTYLLRVIERARQQDKYLKHLDGRDIIVLEDGYIELSAKWDPDSESKNLDFYDLNGNLVLKTFCHELKQLDDGSLVETMGTLQSLLRFNLATSREDLYNIIYKDGKYYDKHGDYSIDPNLTKPKGTNLWEKTR